ncbi:MAG: hypothetical protein ABIQ93_17730 [Saprospiraceae bacterium]
MNDEWLIIYVPTKIGAKAKFALCLFANCFLTIAGRKSRHFQWWPQKSDERAKLNEKEMMAFAKHRLPGPETARLLCQYHFSALLCRAAAPPRPAG